MVRPGIQYHALIVNGYRPFVLQPYIPKFIFRSYHCPLFQKKWGEQQFTPFQDMVFLQELPCPLNSTGYIYNCVKLNCQLYEQIKFRTDIVLLCLTTRREKRTQQITITTFTGWIHFSIAVCINPPAPAEIARISRTEFCHTRFVRNWYKLLETPFVR